VTAARAEATVMPGPVPLERGRAPGWWGMVLLIMTEGMFFLILLTSYWYFRFRHGPTWPPPPIQRPDVFLVGAVMTPVLLLSSIPMHWAERGIARGRPGRLRLGLAVVFAMGAMFLVFTVHEWSKLVHEFTPRTNVYGTLFYTIVGFHGIHVAVGLLLNLWLQYYAWRGAFTAERHLPVQVVAMYWHFVDGVWPFILLTIYLSPRVWP
jgi:heme/copper-type cytochrome/quinol oxidase subunit 3